MVEINITQLKEEQINLIKYLMVINYNCNGIQRELTQIDESEGENGNG